MAERIRALPIEQRRAALLAMSSEQKLSTAYAWRDLHARADQLPPAGDWLVCLALAGRGFGKTRAISEWLLERISAGCGRAAIVGRTAADVRDVLVEGESGILRCSPPWNRPIYHVSKRRLIWKNGAIATCYSAEEPSLLRGPQHDCAIVDEVAAWPSFDGWDNLLMGLRLGQRPQVFAATTPRPLKFLRDLMAESTTVTLRGSTFANRSNLPKAFFDLVVSKYEGTALGRQELEAEILDESSGALWRRAWLEAARVKGAPPSMTRIVVAVDPAVSSGPASCETGIVVAGIGEDKRWYVLDDLSGILTPDQWARRAVSAYESWGADRIVAEVNQGGDLVESTIRTVAPNIPYRAVRASKGKFARAEPIAALYEQGRVSHLPGLTRLEDQLCTWVAGTSDSPDRLDALVWALTELSQRREFGGAAVDTSGPSRWG